MRRPSDGKLVARGQVRLQNVEAQSCSAGRATGPHRLAGVNVWIPDARGHEAIGDLPDGVELRLIPRSANSRRTSSRPSSWCRRSATEPWSTCWHG